MSITELRIRRKERSVVGSHVNSASRHEAFSPELVQKEEGAFE
jgi:hypothetical protein